jgi:PTS system nitrogen regulatory IIA component
MGVMATIRDLLRDDLFIEELEATGKGGVLREFSRLLKSSGRIENEQDLTRVLQERETLGSTGIGDGVAIPHGKLPFLPEMIIAFGRSSKGVDFQSLDEKPVYLFFLLVTPEDRPGEHLKALARISRILKNPVLRENLRRAPDRQELQRLIYEEDGKYPQPQAVGRK